MKKTACFLFAVIMLLSFFGCKRDNGKTVTGIYFDTAVSLTAYGKDVPDGALAMCEKYDRIFSATKKGSDVYKINHSNGKPQTVDKETVSLIKSALKFSEITDGAFDITVYPIKTAWDFYGDTPKVPDKKTLYDAIRHTGYKKIKIKNNTVTLPKGYGIDLGAIAKGYIADRLAKYYEENNTRGIINLGGNVMTVGIKDDGEPYNIGILSPDDSSKMLTSVEILSGSVVTSGTYERKFTENGKDYHHILDMKTGYPVENEIVSVTVSAEKSLTADALSTSVICLGEKRGLELVKSLGAEAVIIHKDGKTVLSNGLSYGKKGNIIEK